jgi:inosine-uridine nucleoside N-ribohydrolase
MKRVIIDTDPGIDDTAALFLALASGALEVEALTTVFGNVEVEHCTRNALTILEVAGRGDIPVYQGVGQPLVREPNLAKYIHGDKGLGGIEVDPPAGQPAEGRAVDEIVRRVMDAPGEITLIALGPLTNVALALAAEPRLAGSLKQLVLMGGAVLTWGNVTPVASANLYNDPEAAALVYRSGAPLVQVGLDVCRPTLITNEHLDRIEQADNPMSRFLMRVTPFHRQAYASAGVAGVAEGRGVHYNDVPCMAYVIQPDLFKTAHYYVEIETQGRLTAGQTVADIGNRWRREPNVHVCMEVDARGVADLFASSLVNPVTNVTA